MKIYTRAVFNWDGEMLEADWYEYDGPIAHCGGGGKAPAAPDPNVTSAAQTKSNKETAAFNAALGSGSTFTPLGNQTSTYRGKDPATGAPIWDTNISLSPDQQQLFDQQSKQNLQLGDFANNMLNQVSGAYGSPMLAPNPGLMTSLNTSGLSGMPAQGDLMGDLQNTQNALYDRQKGFLDPQFQQGQSGLDAQLAAQGITQGSDAYNNAQNNFARQKEFAYGQARDAAIAGGGAEQSRLNDMASSNRAQQFAELMAGGQFQNDAAAQQLSQALTLRDQPLNEFNALRSASPVAMPQFGNTGGGGGISPTDISGNMWNAYNGNMNAYNAQQATANSNTQAGVGLAGTAVMAAVIF